MSKLLDTQKVYEDKKITKDLEPGGKQFDKQKTSSSQLNWLKSIMLGRNKKEYFS